MSIVNLNSIISPAFQTPLLDELVGPDQHYVAKINKYEQFKLIIFIILTVIFLYILLIFSEL